jgi:hypothetical protein
LVTFALYWLVPFWVNWLWGGMSNGMNMAIDDISKITLYIFYAFWIWGYHWLAYWS